jgi:hypothetical protein
MKKLYFLSFILAAYFFTGCATQKPMYYWGDYSATLYDYKISPNADTLAKHKHALYQIIEKSKSRGLRVPPGVYCEYGYILMREGESKEAKRFFELEEQTYPESRFFVQKLKSQINEDRE